MRTAYTEHKATLHISGFLPACPARHWGPEPEEVLLQQELWHHSADPQPLPILPPTKVPGTGNVSIW